MNWMKRLLYKPFFIRLLHWEYWAFHAIYLCVYPVWIGLCARARSFFFFNAANPGIEYGGFLMESKMKIYKIIPPEYYPKTILIRPSDQNESILDLVRNAGIQFPLIVKPDIGARGRGVKKIESETELLPYVRNFPMNLVIQDFVGYENEIGIFYYRYPDEPRGRISGIVGKKFLSVEGDGVSTLEELLLRNKRHILQIPNLRKSLGSGLQVVLPKGELRTLIPYGNHARGALFLDYSEWIDEELELAIDRICKRVPGFYFGRLDIRYESLDLLKKGEMFSIIELNGSGSEPTHMYDPRHSLFFAWHEITRHWKILWKISRFHHGKGVRYLSFSEGVEMFRNSRKYDLILDSYL